MERITISGRKGKKEFNDDELDKLKLNILYKLENGWLADANKKQMNALSKMGYRIKVHQNAKSIKLGKYDIKKESTSPKISTKYKLNKNESEKWLHFLVKLIGPSIPEWVKQIQDLGFDVVQVLGQNTLFVCGNHINIPKIENLGYVEFVSNYEPAYKVHDNLKGKSGKVKVRIRTLDYDLSKDLNKFKGTIFMQSPNLPKGYQNYFIEIDYKDIGEISHHLNVVSIELYTEDQLDDERSNQIIAEDLDGVAAPNTAPNVNYLNSLANMGLTGGNGLTIAICDSGVCTHNNATMQGDLAGKLNFFVDISGGAVITDISGHGTHVAGIAAGSGATGDTDPQNFILGQGVAPQANVGSINAIGTGGASTIQTRVTSASNNNSNVMNNSWGGAINNGYSQRCSDLDGLVRDPLNTSSDFFNLLQVYSAGNSGPNANTLSDPKEAKNIIVVGNSFNFRPGEGDLDDIRGLRPSSSRGPAVDGRFSPTIVAPGTNIISARPNTDSDPATPGQQRPRTAYSDTNGIVHQNHFSTSGTSMASPHVAGVCALLIEWWRQRTNGFDPSQAMVKALLVNGAIDIVGGPTGRLDGSGNPIAIANIPNNDQGWGRVSLENIILQNPDSDRGPKIFSDQRRAFTVTGQEHIIQVAAVDETRPLRITLVWTDAPGAANANPALVNDLDLEVTQESDGDLFRGNVFNNGFSVTGGTADSLNNIECVYVQNPTGTYEVRIFAAAITTDARPPFNTANPWQDYALVIDNAEIVPENNVSVVPVIDRSGSMVSAGYVDITRFSSKAFVDLLGFNDELGITSFGTTASTDYSNGANIKDLNIAQDKEDAKNAIEAIPFGGSTFMAGGINLAKDLLDSTTNEKAMILFSDGYDNRGFNSSNPWATAAVAALPPDIKVHTCAMGPSSDQTLLSDIASDTDGLYYYMPSIDDLFEIYNYIRGAITGDSIIANQSSFASHREIDAFVDTTASYLTINLGWYNSRLNYTGGEPTRKDQIGIRLKDPSGRYLNSNSSLLNIKQGDDYVIIKVNEPVAGNWKIVVDTKFKSHTRFTVGAFIDSQIKLHLPNIRTIPLGIRDLQIPFNVSDSTNIIGGLKVVSHLLSPNFSINKIKRKFAKDLRKIKIPKKNQGDLIIDNDITKINILNSQLVKEGKRNILNYDLTKVRSSLASLKDVRRIHENFLFSKLKLDGKFSSRNSNNEITKNQIIILPELKKKGSHNLIVNVQGYSEKHKTKFVRKGMISLNVK